ncbi:proline-rich protein 36-like [Homarus americanus]|uniref:proline-rich protein 36-like n=1 Tax=Homarus americanus TaxID=6706 RepID=UPI001C46594B|nr:proline-rich protein 36-like [Homarus americanus]
MLHVTDLPANISTSNTRPTNSQPLNSELSESRPSNSRPSDNRPSNSRPPNTELTDSRPSDNELPDSRPSNSRPSNTRPPDSRPGDPPQDWSDPGIPQVVVKVWDFKDGQLTLVATKQVPSSTFTHPGVPHGASPLTPISMTAEIDEDVAQSLLAQLSPSGSQPSSSSGSQLSSSGSELSLSLGSQLSSSSESQLSSPSGSQLSSPSGSQLSSPSGSQLSSPSGSQLSSPSGSQTSSPQHKTKPAGPYNQPHTTTTIQPLSETHQVHQHVPPLHPLATEELQALMQHTLQQPQQTHQQPQDSQQQQSQQTLPQSQILKQPQNTLQQLQQPEKTQPPQQQTLQQPQYTHHQSQQTLQQPQHTLQQPQYTYQQPQYSLQQPQYILQQPQQPLHQPQQLLQQPQQTLKQPHQPLQPQHTLQQPYHSLQQPHHSLQQPHQTLQQPQHSLQQPQQTLQQPHQTLQPQHTLQQPQHSLQQPHHSLQQPHHTLQQPHQTLQQPHQPLQPHHTLQQPQHTLQQPHQTLKQPYQPLQPQHTLQHAQVSHQHHPYPAQQNVSIQDFNQPLPFSVAADSGHVDILRPPPITDFDAYIKYLQNVASNDTLLSPSLLPSPSSLEQDLEPPQSTPSLLQQTVTSQQPTPSRLHPNPFIYPILSKYPNSSPVHSVVQPTSLPAAQELWLKPLSLQQYPLPLQVVPSSLLAGFSSSPPQVTASPSGHLVGHSSPPVTLHTTSQVLETLTQTPSVQVAQKNTDLFRDFTKEILQSLSYIDTQSASVHNTLVSHEDNKETVVGLATQLPTHSGQIPLPSPTRHPVVSADESDSYNTLNDVISGATKAAPLYTHSFLTTPLPSLTKRTGVTDPYSDTTPFVISQETSSGATDNVVYNWQIINNQEEPNTQDYQTPYQDNLPRPIYKHRSSSTSTGTTTSTPKPFGGVGNPALLGVPVSLQHNSNTYAEPTTRPLQQEPPHIFGGVGNDALDSYPLIVSSNFENKNPDSFVSLESHNPLLGDTTQIADMSASGVIDDQSLVYPPPIFQPMYGDEIPYIDDDLYNVSSAVWQQLQQLPSFNNLFAGIDINDPRISGVIQSLVLQSIGAIDPQLLHALELGDGQLRYHHDSLLSIPATPLLPLRPDIEHQIKNIIRNQAWFYSGIPKYNDTLYVDTSNMNYFDSGVSPDDTHQYVHPSIYDPLAGESTDNTNISYQNLVELMEGTNDDILPPPLINLQDALKQHLGPFLSPDTSDYSPSPSDYSPSPSDYSPSPSDYTPSPTYFSSFLMHSSPSPTHSSPSPTHSSPSPTHSSPSPLDPLQHTLSPDQLVPAPPQLVPDPLQLVPAPPQLVPDPLQLVPAPPQLVPDPLQLVPAPPQLVPDPLQLVPAPPQLVPDPLQLVPAPPQLVPDRHQHTLAPPQRLHLI